MLRAQHTICAHQSQWICNTEETKCEGVSYDDDLGRNISGSIFGTEGLRADDIACAVADQIQGSYGCFLCPSGHVGGDQTEQSDEARW